MNRRLLFRVVLCSIAVTGTALAQTAADVAARQRLIEQADQARLSGDHRHALEFSRRAGAVRMSPSLRRFIAEEHESLGQLVEAFAAARQCVAEAEANVRAQDRDAVLRDCGAMATRIEPQLGTLRIEPPRPVSAGLQVTLNGQPFQGALLGQDYYVMPGRAVIGARSAAGHRECDPVEVRMGVRTVVRVAQCPLTPPPEVHRGPGAGPWVVGGVGVTALGGALVTAVLYEAEQEAQSACVDEPAAQTCPSEASFNAAETQETLRVVNHVLFFGGLAALAGGVIWYVAGRGTSPPAPTPAWNLHVAPLRAGLSLGVSGSF